MHHDDFPLHGVEPGEGDFQPSAYFPPRDREVGEAIVHVPLVHVAHVSQIGTSPGNPPDAFREKIFGIVAEKGAEALGVGCPFAISGERRFLVVEVGADQGLVCAGYL